MIIFVGITTQTTKNSTNLSKNPFPIKPTKVDLCITFLILRSMYCRKSSNSLTNEWLEKNFTHWDFCCFSFYF